MEELKTDSDDETVKVRAKEPVEFGRNDMMYGPLADSARVTATAF